MTQTENATLEDIDSAFASLVFPDFSDELDQFDETNQLDAHELSRQAPK